VQNQALITALRRDLDWGEAETIALALELKADLVLLDEREGRRAAQRLGLHVVGVVGVLVEAKANDALDALRPHLDALRQTAGFYLSESLYRHALEQMGEHDE
jgi:predicted nucleic acid-binding protein